MSHDWTTGLCDCAMDCPSFFEAWCCAPCFISAQCNRLRNDATGCSVMWCCVGACFPVCSVCWVRSTVRERYGFDGSGFGDLCTSCCCMCCSSTQTYRELSARDKWPGGCLCVREPFTAVKAAAPQTMGEMRHGQRAAEINQTNTAQGV